MKGRHSNLSSIAVTWTPYNVLAVMYGILGPEKGDTVSVIVILSKELFCLRGRFPSLP